MSLAAVVDEKIFCVHGGIGTILKKIEDVDNIPKPFDLNYEAVNTSYQQQIAYDLLWSDPVSSETINDNEPNPARDFIIKGKTLKFGFNRIKRFLAENNLLMILRYKYFITLFFLKKNLQLIYIFFNNNDFYYFNH